MRPCLECGKRLRDPGCRHQCPHGRSCIGPSTHTVKSIHRPKGVTQKDRELYCPECSAAYYEREREAQAPLTLETMPTGLQA